MPSKRLLPLVLAALALTAGDASAASRSITFTQRADALSASGSTGLHAGFARVTVRNTTDEPHGLLLVRLKRDVGSAQVVRAIATNDPARTRPLVTFLGGIQSVAPGGTWEMTADLAAGHYLALDYGSAEQPRVRGFEVLAGGARGDAPRTAGRLALTDYAFVGTLPKRFSGHGVVEIPNVGREWHEISLVRTPPGKTAADVLDLLHAGNQEPPPGYEINELLWVLDPGRTAFVRFDLAPGHYVALCLIPEPKSQQLHADLGMVTEFDVGQ